MLPPHELKTKKFSTVFRGYSPEEVNDQIAFLIEQYTELYKENDELERKLRMALAQLDSYKSDEESIRSALVNAQKAGARILRDASDRADTLMQATKSTCETMVSESAAAIRQQYAVLTTLREQTRIMRETLISQYNAQFELIQATIRDEREAGCEVIADEELVHSIISGIKEEAVRRSERGDRSEADADVSDASFGDMVGEKPADAESAAPKKPRTGTIWNKETVQNAAPSPRKVQKTEETPAIELPALPEKVEEPAEPSATQTESAVAEPPAEQAANEAPEAPVTAETSESTELPTAVEAEETADAAETPAETNAEKIADEG